MPTLYQVLGVPENATAASIKSAFRKLSMQYHPDRNPGNAAAEAHFRVVLEAYRILSDADDRLRYDRQLAWSRIQPEPAQQRPVYQSPPSQREQSRRGRFDTDLNSHRNEWEKPFPSNMPWRLVGISLFIFILFFVLLYNFGSKYPDSEVRKPDQAGLPDRRELSRDLSISDGILSAISDTLSFAGRQSPVTQLAFNESKGSFGTESTPARFITIYFTSDRHDYRDYVLIGDDGKGLKRIFRYVGGTWRNGTQIKLFFGRDVEPASCGECEIQGLPHPGITGIYLRELRESYRFEVGGREHDAKIRGNLEWLATNFGANVPEGQYLRQILTWHFLHRAEGSAESVFREYYTENDVDARWAEIARMIAIYEMKIASDVRMQPEAI